MPLTARIRTRDGWAVSHAVVTLTDGTGSQVLRAEADDEGAVRDATELAPGAYTVVVTAVGYAPAAASALVTASGRAEIGTVTLARTGGTELPPPGPWTVDPAHSSVAAAAQRAVDGRVTRRRTQAAEHLRQHDRPVDRPVRGLHVQGFPGAAFHMPSRSYRCIRWR